MSQIITAPEPGEHISLNVHTAFLLVGREATAWNETPHLLLSGGQMPIGAGTFGLFFENTEYAREMVGAVKDAIDHVNAKWGLPATVIDGTFTGAAKP